jgi:alkaline phosphatase D
MSPPRRQAFSSEPLEIFDGAQGESAFTGKRCEAREHHLAICAMTANEEQWPPHGEKTGPGIVTHRAARIWARCRRAESHQLRLTREFSDENSSIEVTWDATSLDQAHNTQSIVYPDDFSGATDLLPSSCYRYEICDQQGLLGQGRFHTAPLPTADRSYAGEPFSIAFLSCHQPYQANGDIDDEAKNALARLPQVLEDRNVRRVICLGDQMYADMPDGKSLFDEAHFAKVSPRGVESLFDCSADEVAQLYRERFSDSFALGGFSQAIANWSTTMICDDHEIVDNFGSDPEHSGPRWASIREGALQAIFDYEGLRQQKREAKRPASMHFSWEYGPISAFVMDLRSQRTATAQELTFFSAEQLRDLERYLHEQRDAAVFLLGLGIPLAFAPNALIQAGIAIAGQGSDVAERWWNDKAVHSRRQLTELIERHTAANPTQIMILVSGDVHAGSVSDMYVGKQPVYQLISSAITNHESALTRTIAETLPHFGPWEQGDVRWGLMKNEVDGRNPYSGLNLGLLTVTPQKNGTHAELHMEIVGIGETEGTKVMFRSAPLLNHLENPR